MRYILLFGLFCSSLLVLSQQSVSSGGGNSSGSGGSVSFTIGQVAWNMFSGTSGSVVQGVQQPYEISFLNSIDVEDVVLNYLVYPNPTTGRVTLCINNEEYNKYRYLLYSIVGIILQQDNIGAVSTEVHMEDYPPSTYFLKILKGENEIKLFKIVKN